MARDTETSGIAREVLGREVTEVLFDDEIAPIAEIEPVMTVAHVRQVGTLLRSLAAVIAPRRAAPLPTRSIHPNLNIVKMCSDPITVGGRSIEVRHGPPGLWQPPRSAFEGCDSGRSLSAGLLPLRRILALIRKRLICS